jgi:GTP-binding protein
VDEEHVGFVMTTLNTRKGEVLDMGPVPGTMGRTRIFLTCPSRSVETSALLITYLHHLLS